MQRIPYTAIGGYLIARGIICPDCADDVSTSVDPPDHLDPVFAVRLSSADVCCMCAGQLPNTYSISPAAHAHFSDVSAARQRAALIDDANAQHDPVTGLYHHGDLVVNVRTRTITTISESNPPAAPPLPLPDYQITDAAWRQLEAVTMGDPAHATRLIATMVRVVETSAGMLTYRAHGLVAHKRGQTLMTEAEAATL